MIKSLSYDSTTNPNTLAAFDWATCKIIIAYKKDSQRTGIASVDDTTFLPNNFISLIEDFP
jgi:hypothetical protein